MPAQALEPARPPAGGASEQTFRVQFDFSSEALRELDNLKTKIGAATRAEVVRYALRTLQWVIQQIQSDTTILVETNGRTREVVFPFLPSNVASNKHLEAAVAK